MKPPIYFVADLHMFARRSQPERYENQLQRTFARASTVVFGGDLFDFRWSTLDTVDATIAAAVEWLREHVATHAHCQFYYVLGNHDFHPGLMSQLDRLAEEEPRFRWEPYYLQMGTGLFLHGDVADRPMRHDELVDRRQRWGAEHRQAARFRHHLYDAAIEMRLHKLAGAVAFRDQTVAKRIHHYCCQLDQVDWEQLENVYFGHTHVPLDGYKYRGVTLHNGGAPIKGLEFRVVEALIA